MSDTGEEIFQTEFDDMPEAMPGDPVIKYADRIMDRMRDIMPPAMSIHAFTPPELEFKVKLFRFDESTDLAQVEREIETLLNDRWHCTDSAACGNVLILPFTRPKENTKQ